MKILDRYVLRNFMISYLIMGFVLIGLYVLADLTLNSDEFTEVRELTASQILGNMGSYYGHQIFVYFRQLAGIITLVSAIVTLTMMNRRNEMTAILASGVSLYRVIWPVIVLGLVFNGLTLLDQEFAIPRMADKLVRAHDEVAKMKQFNLYFYPMLGAWSEQDRCVVGEVRGADGGPRPPDAAKSLLLRVDDEDGGPQAVGQLRTGDLLAIHVGRSNKIRVYAEVAGPEGTPAGSRLPSADAVPVSLFPIRPDQETVLALPAEQSLARVAPGDLIVPVSPPKYLFTALKFNPSSRHHDMRDVRIIKRHARTRDPLAKISVDLVTWNSDLNAWDLGGDASTVLLTAQPTGQTFVPGQADAPTTRRIYSLDSPREIILRHSSRHWLQFMSTPDLKRLADSGGAGGAEQARSIMHIRFTQPVINMILLLLGVPFVLSRAPGNLWQGILKCVLICGSCFVLSFVCQQIAGDATRLAVVAAWLPVILFGPLAVLMLDSVKT